MAVFCIIILFARPFKSSDPLNKLHNPQIPIYLWVDHSLSMNYTSESVSIGQLAYNLIDSLQKILPASSKLFLYDQKTESFSLKEMSPSFSSNYEKVDLDKALQYFQNTQIKPDPIVILFSDFQSPVKNVLVEKLAQISKPISVICVPVNQPAPWNYSLSNLRIDGQDGVAINATLKTFGKPLKNGEATAEINNMRVGRKKIELSENKSTTITINCNLLSGNSAGKISLNSNDPLSFDNYAYFVSEIASAARVIIIGDKEECDPIGFALKVSSQKWNIKLKEGPEVSFDDLDSSDLIIINKPVAPAKALYAFLNDRSGNNKPVIFCYGVDDESNEWSDAILSEMLSSFKKQCLIKHSETPLSPVLPDTTSELWQKFQKLNNDEVAIYDFCSGISGDVLLKLTDGSPLMIKTEDKKGRKWLILTTPLGVTNANNLSETGFFVPFVDRICRYVISSNQLTSDTWVAGKLYRNPHFGSDCNFTIFNDASRMVGVVQKDQPYFSFEKPGIYKVAPQNEPSYLLAVQADPDESNLQYSYPENSNVGLSNIAVINKELFLSSVANNGNNIAIYVIWLILFVLLLAEILLWERNK